MVCFWHRELYVFDGDNSAVICKKCAKVYSVDLQDKKSELYKSGWRVGTALMGVYMDVSPGVLIPTLRKEVPSVTEYLRLVDAKITKDTEMDEYTRKQLESLGLIA